MAAIALSGVAHRRFDPLRGSWVLIASPQKNKRPRLGQIEEVLNGEKKAYDPKLISLRCYLCPGNRRASGNRNPHYNGTFLFENDYSTVRMDEERCHGDIDQKESFQQTNPALLHAEPVIGQCYVVTYSPNHHYKISDMTTAEVLDIIETWTNVYAMHLSSDSPLKSIATELDSSESESTNRPSSSAQELCYMHIFDNNGSIVGASNPHPHGQIWITSSMPDEPRRELVEMKNYREKNCGSHLLSDYVQLEIDKEERVVWQNGSFLAVCPWWAVWPYEVLLLPKRQVASLVDLTNSERLDFAEAMLQLNRIYDNLFGITFPYVSAVHQAPLNAIGVDLDSSFLHVHFSPPLLFPSIKKFFGGYELYGEPTREITPEAASAHLRSALVQPSVCSNNYKASCLPARPVRSFSLGLKRKGARNGESTAWWRWLLQKRPGI